MTIRAEDIKRVCCLCGKHLGGSETARFISHGFCPVCEEKTLREYEKKRASKKD